MYCTPGCNDCNQVYIGETGRPIGERIKEHQRDVRLSRVDGSAVAEHAWGAGHHPNWDDVRCIDREQHWYTRRIKEAIHIHLRENNINRDSGIDIPGFWLPTIRHHDHRATDGTTPADRRVNRTTSAGETRPQSAEHGTVDACTDRRSHAEDTPPTNPGVRRTTSAAVIRSHTAEHGIVNANPSQQDITDPAASSSSVA